MATLHFLLATIFSATIICGDPSPSNDLIPIRDQVALTYEGEVGVREIGGNNRGPGPRKYLASVNLGEGYAWCAAFVKWVFNEHGIDTGSANAWSPSWFPNDRVIFRRGQVPKVIPDKGDVFGLYYHNLRRIGHVGFVHDWSSDWVITVEGNTNGDGSRDGDGVHRKRRLKKQIYVVSRYIS